MTYAELQDEASLLVIDTPASVQQIMPRLIQRAHRKIMQKHDYVAMQAELEVTTVEGQRLLTTLPSDWKKQRDVPYYIESLGGVHEMTEIVPKGDALSRWGGNTDLGRGAPHGLNQSSTDISVYPIPDGNSDYSDGEYRVVIPYWKYLPTLTNPTDADWFTDIGDTAIIYQAVADAFFADHDETNGLLWQQRTASEFKDLVLVDKDRMVAATTSLVYHTGARMPHTQE